MSVGTIKGHRNNHRRFPGIKGRRPDRKASRIQLAIENSDRWNGLTTSEKLADLDRRLGKGQGATRERERLMKALLNHEPKESKQKKKTKERA